VIIGTSSVQAVDPSADLHAELGSMHAARRGGCQLAAGQVHAPGGALSCA